MTAPAHEPQPRVSNLDRSPRLSLVPPPPPAAAPGRRSVLGQPLVPTELETVCLVASGLSYDEVAARMGVPVSTVRGRLRSAGRKLGTRGTAGVVAVCLRTGLVRMREREAGPLGLTATQRAVVRSVADGLTSPQIAARLGLTRSAVAMHLHRVGWKFGSGRRAAIVARCWQAGLLR